jgi:predicted amidohydrolase
MKIYLHQTKINEIPEINYKYFYEVFENNLNADIIVCPEVFLSGFDFKNLDSIVLESESYLRKIQTMCQSSKTAFLGSFLWKEKNRYFNRAFFIDETGGFLGIYDKQHLIPAFQEEQYLSAGKENVFFSFKGMQIGLAVCYDLRFPELFRQYAAKETDLIFLIAQWPLERIDHMITLARARAIENQCYVIVVNAIGQSRNQTLGGHSMVIGPKGDILLDLGKSHKGKPAQIHLAEVLKWRAEFPALYQYSRPNIFRPNFLTKLFNRFEK